MLLFVLLPVAVGFGKLVDVENEDTELAELCVLEGNKLDMLELLLMLVFLKFP